MGGPRHVLVGLLAALAAGLGGCVGATASEPGGDGDGRLSVGDTWTTAMAYHEGGWFNVTQIHTVTAVGPHRGHEVYQVDIAMRYDPGLEREGRVSNRTETSWYRVSDFASVENRYEIEGYIFPEEGHPYLKDGLHYRETSATVHAEPCVQTPGDDLEVGQEWTSTCRSSTTTEEWNSKDGSDWHNSTGERTTLHRVEAEEAITVEAGTFHAYRIASRSDPAEDTQSTATSWVARQSCLPEPVKLESAYENEEHAGETIVELVKLDC